MLSCLDPTDLIKCETKFCLFIFLAGNVPNILHQVTVPIIDNDKCQNMFIKSGHKKTVRESFLCAGYDEGKKDSCEVRIHMYIFYYSEANSTYDCVNTCKNFGRNRLRI